MAIQKPLSTPWLVTLADANEHTLDFSDCINAIFGVAAGRLPSIKVRATLKTGGGAGLQMRAASERSVVDEIDANNPVYAIGTTVETILYPNQTLRVKAALAGTINIEI